MRDGTGTQMEAKEFAKLFGGFSTEKRVRLLRALIDAGPPGLSLLDLSRKTELSVIDIGITAEALVMIDLIDISIKGENKVLFANFDLIRSLFEKSYYAFGTGRDKPPAPDPEPEPEAEAEAGSEPVSESESVGDTAAKSEAE